MKDADLIAALEDCTLPASEFTHANHVRAGYQYRDTNTVAFLALIRERMIERGDGGGWEEFAAQNLELLEGDRLLRYFPREQLESDHARRVFVLPCAVRAT